jgi:hypothetical protein
MFMACRQKTVLRSGQSHQSGTMARAWRRTGDNCGDNATSALRKVKPTPVIASVEKFAN